MCGIDFLGSVHSNALGFFFFLKSCKTLEKLFSIICAALRNIFWCASSQECLSINWARWLGASSTTWRPPTTTCAGERCLVCRVARLNCWSTSQWGEIFNPCPMCASIQSEAPFEGAYGNLKRLFDKAAKMYQQVKKQEMKKLSPARQRWQAEAIIWINKSDRDGSRTPETEGWKHEWNIQESMKRSQETLDLLHNLGWSCQT